MHARWRDRVIWMERAAKKANTEYYVLHVLAIIGGALVTALASLNVVGGGNYEVRVFTVIISLVVTISVALEGYFGFGEKWRHYRRNVEVLLSEGWEFLELTGRYRGFNNHSEAYKDFAENVEELIRSEVQMYITKVVREKKESSSNVAA